MSRHETPKTVAEAVADFRDSSAAIRKIRRNGGRTAATSRAVARHQTIADRAMRYLLDAGERNIAGELTEEAGLIDNIAISVTARPDLQRRLVVARRRVRRRVQYIEVMAER